jgi:hypothetical protein
VAASLDARQPRYTASLVKLLVVQQLLERAGDGDVVLSNADLVHMKRAIVRSWGAARGALDEAASGVVQALEGR